MRIGDSGLVLRFLEAFRSNREALDRAVGQLADGKQVRRASDDPSGAQSSLQLRARLAALGGFSRAAALARADLQTIDDVLGETVRLLSDARETAVEGGSAAADPGILAARIDSLRDELLGLADTTQNGRALFAGTQTLLIPFGPGGAYAGNAAEVRVPIDTRETVGSTLAGSRVFLDGGDLFATLDELAAALRSGDTAAQAELATVLDGQIDHVASVRADVGLRLDRIDRTLERQQDEDLRLRERIAAIEDVDLERVAIDLASLDASYQALSTSAARVLGRSLFDFLG